MSGKSESTFEKALRLWTEVDLPNLQKQLDQSGSEIQELQSKSLESRKNLAVKTKVFKRSSDEEKLNEIKNLLKDYQHEVDSLTNRAKFSESSFLQVYRSIGELPDPKPLLEVSIDSVIQSQEIEEVKKLNHDLQLELLKFADYEQLKLKLSRLEEKSNETLKNRLKLKEDELKAGFEEKVNNWNSKEDEYKAQIEEFQKQLKDLTTQRKIDKLKLKNQRIALGEDPEDYKDDEDEEADGKTVDDTVPRSDVEILQKENDLKNQRIIQLEQRNEELIKELKVSKSDLIKEDVKISKELKLQEFEKENATLVAKLEHSQLQYDTSIKQSNKKLNNYKRELTNLTNDLKNSKDKLQKYRDYEDIKQELSTLRAITFGQNDEDDEDDGDGDGVKSHAKIGEEIDEDEDEQDPVKSTSSTQLDEILVLRNKKLTNEITEYRSKHDALNKLIESLQLQLKNSQTEIIKLTTLNENLENDLSHVQQGSKFDTMSVMSGITKATSNTRGVPSFKRVSPASSIAGGIIAEESNEQSSSSASVLPIITSQRDRFRSRNFELETQLKKQTNVINELKSEISKLKKHNNELFEKTKYLSSFNKGSVQRLNQNDPEKLYENNYEESLHPLAKFRQREQERVASKLSPLERIFLSFAKAILANKTSRMLFLGYCIGLHCLVMAMSVYVMSLHGSLVPEVGKIDRSSTKIV